MTERPLEGRCILVVEDEYLLASDLAETLNLAGADVRGPVPSVEEAMDMIAAQPRIDAAILDVNLRGSSVYPVADRLTSLDVPFAFLTGYDSSTIPERYSHMPHFEKPAKISKITSIIGGLIQNIS